ncbi:BA14K family protein [Methylobacterium brachythecii]|nr:BA14K family protein [Methylobacterium brachythecii]
MAARPPGIGGLPTAVGPTLGPGVNPGRPGFPGNVSPGGPGRPGGIADGGFGGRPGWNRPGRPGGIADGGFGGRPGWNRPGRPGGHHHHHGWHGRPYPAYGFGVGTGFGYGYGYPYGNGYYDDYYAPAAYDDESSAPAGDAQAAYCAQRFKTYDPQTRTYVGKGGKRRSCP